MKKTAYDVITDYVTPHKDEAMLESGMLPCVAVKIKASSSSMIRRESKVEGRRGKGVKGVGV